MSTYNWQRKLDPEDAIGVIRRDDRGFWWMMNRRKRGWGEFGYAYRQLADLERAWCVQAGPERSDEHGSYWPLTYRITKRQEVR
jgi:hypothetical protein